MNFRKQSTDIYKDAIIPLIQAAKPGDELQFISPSTFFGFYSLGARVYWEVWHALKAAKQRQVKIRLVVNVRDYFTAKAARGLLQFLEDNEEIRTRKNDEIYRITLVASARNQATLYDFDSQSTKPELIDPLEDIYALPFKDSIEKKTAQNNDSVRKIDTVFRDFWQHSRPVSESLKAWDPVLKSKHAILLQQFVSNSMLFLFGLAIGAWIMWNSTSEKDEASVPKQVMITLLGSIVSFSLALVLKKSSKKFLKIDE